MSEVTGKLKDGLKIGDETHKNFVLREGSAGDVIDASVESERLLETPRGPALVSSPALAEMHLLRRQVNSIGSYDGVLTLEMLKKLTQEDFNILRAAADSLQIAVQQGVGERGRSDPPSEDD